MMDDQIGDKTQCVQIPPHCVRVKRKCMRNLNLEKIVVFYGVKLLEVPPEDTVADSASSTSTWINFQVVPVDAGSGLDVPEVTKRVQVSWGISLMILSSVSLYLCESRGKIARERKVMGTIVKSQVLANRM